MRVNIAIVRIVPPSTFESYVASNIFIEYAVNWDNKLRKCVFKQMIDDTAIYFYALI